MSLYSREISQGQRFAFGRNWQRFIETFDESGLEVAIDSLRRMLDVETLDGKTFLDAGCGSGAFALAAARLGARVHAFDYDAESVACAQQLGRRYRSSATDWIIEQGSVLDQRYLGDLGTFDIVYSWGVLHHTGAMWDALENVTRVVRPGGTLLISLYNDAGASSKGWARLKALYNRVPAARSPLVLFGLVRLRAGMILQCLLSGHPVKVWRAYADNRRGMSAWHDLIDWVGGYPYEYATRESVIAFLEKRGFQLRRMKSIGNGLGCNEFLFEHGGGASGESHPSMPS